ncbi:MAG: hypothetical protein ABJF10_24545 [Chthoniobacter sp.]|uniref:hypothetical protein n=1 Tax=Chthoniobacter sp. TaxID=2510640 RepID=UPI0032A8D4CD
MKKSILILLTALAFCSCASKPVVYKAPSSAAIDASAAELHRAVAAATVTHHQVQAATKQAKIAVDDQTKHLDILTPALDAMFKTAPIELRPEIADAQKEVAAIRLDNTGVVAQLGAITSLQTIEGNQLEEAAAADKQHAADKAQYEAEADQLAEKASAESVARAAAENKVHELESKNWIRRALEALAAVGLLVVGFLYFTGKLTLSAASVAARF